MKMSQKLAALIGYLSECVAYDNEDPDLCVEYENNELYSNFLGIATISLFLGWIPGFFWGRKYLKQWAPLNEEYQVILSIQGAYQDLSRKYNSTSSIEIINQRAALIKWVEELTPDDETMLLNV